MQLKNQTVQERINEKAKEFGSIDTLNLVY